MSVTRASSTTLIIPAPGSYRLDPLLSDIALHTTHMFGLGGVDATVALRSGRIDVTDRVENSRVEATADAASFDTGNPGRDKRVRSKAFLDAAASPEIAFVSHSVARAGDSWVVRGTLTARGQDAPCELTVTGTVQRPDGVTVVATGTVDRYAHGITGAKGLAGRYLELTVTAALRPAASAA